MKISYAVTVCDEFVEIQKLLSLLLKNKRKDTSPFKLTQNECVISYSVNGKRLYYKISNLKKGESIAYPSAPPKNR